jgi:hypothetical protein
MERPVHRHIIGRGLRIEPSRHGSSHSPITCFGGWSCWASCNGSSFDRYTNGRSDSCDHHSSSCTCGKHHGDGRGHRTGSNWSGDNAGDHCSSGRDSRDCRRCHGDDACSWHGGDHGRSECEAHT